MKKNNRLLSEWKDSGNRQQLCRKMKCVLVFMLMLVWGVRAEVWSQQYMLDLQLQETPLAEVFSHMESQTGLKFLYNAMLIESKGRVDVEARNADVRQVLDELLRPLGLTYVLERDQVVVKKAAPAVPQEKTLKGKITDEMGNPLPGVTVRLDSTSSGVVTDAEGNFTLRTSQREGYILVSFIGYKTQRLFFSGDRVFKIKMTEEVQKLDEVQVVAYGEMSKREVTGSISTIKADNLHDNASSDLITKMQGQLAGVAITTTSGAPGGQASITVRGHNTLSVETARLGSEPLFVIDDVPVYTNQDIYSGINPLSLIPAGDIERIDVLKDAASCAMYGSRAANGVVMIRTKSGRYNEKFTVSAGILQTFSFLSLLPEKTVGNGERNYFLRAYREHQEAYYDYETNSWRYVSSPEEAEEMGLHYDYFWNKGTGSTMPYLQDSLNKFYNNKNSWYKKVFQVNKVTDANINLSGGSNTIAYNLGFGYYKETGAMIHTGFSRASLSGNLSFKPHPKVSGRLNLALSRIGLDRVNKDVDPYSNTGNPTNVPEMPAFVTELSSLVIPPGSKAEEIVLGSYNDMREDNDSYRFRTSFNLGYEVISGLKLKTSFSLDYLGMHRNTFKPSRLDEYSQAYSNGSDIRNVSGLNENTVSYDRWFNEKHHLRALAGISIQMDQFNSISGYGRGGNDKIYYVPQRGNPVDELTQRQLKEYNSDKTKSSLVSVFARIGYNYKDKYMVEAAFRQDGSSRFGNNTRWGSFPSVSVGYAFSEEKFMENLKHILSYGKLRLSYGKTGKQFESPYLAQGAYGPGNITFLSKPTMLTVELPNPDLSWEKTDQYDAGLDLDFFDYRIGMVLDYYFRNSYDMLYYITLPGDFTGFRERMENRFGIQNQGVEFTLKADMIRNNKVKWNVSLNIARNWNRLVESHYNHRVANPVSDVNVSIIGKEMNRLYVFDDRGGFYKSQDEVPYFYNYGEKTYLGRFNQYYRVGDRMIRDVNKDGVIDDNDRIDAGSVLPKASGGIVSSLEWNGLDVNIVLPYSLGRHILYANNSLAVSPGRQQAILYDLSDLVFYEDGVENANMPPLRMANELNNFSPYLMSNVYKNSILTIKQVTVGYTLPKSVLKNIILRFFVTGENLYTFSTRFPGRDPLNANYLTGVYNNRTYPNSRKITFGLTIKL